jgi:hypothetical protein
LAKPRGIRKTEGIIASPLLSSKENAHLYHPTAKSAEVVNFADREEGMPRIAAEEGFSLDRDGRLQ